MAEIAAGYVPGALDRIIELHETYYIEQWNLDFEFSGEVAVELAEYLNRDDDWDNRIWLMLGDPDEAGDQEILGSLVIDGHCSGDDARGTRLRWFILAPELNVQSLGREILKRALEFLYDVGYQRVHQWTFEGLDAAHHLYETDGFTIAEQHIQQDRRPEIADQKFEKRLE